MVLDEFVAFTVILLVEFVTLLEPLVALLLFKLPFVILLLEFPLSVLLVPFVLMVTFKLILLIV